MGIPCVWWRLCYIFVVKDSGLLDLLQPKDQVMADRSFKIRTELAMKQCTLSLPPSAAKGNQMTSSDVKNTSNIDKLRIFVEQAIKCMTISYIEDQTINIIFACI